MLRVRCQANATLDAKGRLALPAPIRRALGEHGVDSLVLTFHKGAVWGWTAGDFEEHVERPLLARDPFDTDVMDFTHAILSPAQDVEIDSAGRVRVPPPLRDLAGLDKEVVVSSVLNRIEIWDKDTWESRFRTSVDRTDGRSGMPGSVTR
ncbi:MAG: division/cell wall cluster transcriptional repressor MraZ [Alphaproteobacteria bacterium]|nr:division/cell wall cluster transcriptional repressor MraZ [Alphaproteobacteria bacterium]